MLDKSIKNNLKLMGIGIAVAVSIGIVSMVSYGDTITDLQNRINNAQQQINTNNQNAGKITRQMEAINSRISSTKSEIDELSSEVATAYDKLVEANQNLEEGKKKLNDQNKNLGARLRNIYKSGGVAFIDVILASSNPSELFSNLEMVKYIFKNDKNIVETLKKNYESLQKERDEVSAMEAALKSKQETLTAKQNALGKDYALLEKQKEDVENKNKELSKEIQQWQADSNAIRAAILNSQNNSRPSTGGNTGGGGGTTTPPSGGGGARGFIYPINGPITSGFGYRIHPVTGRAHGHTGVDFAGSYGTPVKASKAGTVVIAGWHNSYGNYVVINHGNSVSTVYGHNSSLAVSAGQSVSQGQTIAYVGSTGMSTGNHVHFEVRINGNPVNPMNYL